MATLEQKIEAEARMREILADGGLPDPDWVEFGEACIRLFFEDPKLVVVLDLDDDSEADRPLEIESH